MKDENPHDMKTFARLVFIMRKDKVAHHVDFPIDRFGGDFKTFLLKEDIEDIHFVILQYLDDISL